MDPFLSLAAATAALFGVRRTLRGAKSAVQPRSSRSERRRRQACAEVLAEVASRRGYLPSLAGREELTELIDGGMEPAALLDMLRNRAAGVAGTLLGHDAIVGQSLPVILPPSLLMRHMLVPGKTGTGKSTLLTNLCLQFALAGFGFATIVPEPEFIDGLLERIREERWDDIILIDPSDSTAPVVLNPLHLDGQDLDLKVSQTLAILQRICGDDGNTGAMRLETILRRGLLALTSIPGSSLLDFMKLLDRSDDRFRNWVIGQLQDEETRYFWSSIYPSYPRDSHLSVVNRLERFLAPRPVRNFLCTPGKSLNVRREMDRGRIMLFVPADGLIGDEPSQVLAQFFATALQLATMSRADTPASARRPFVEVIDEFQVFAGSAGASISYERSFQRARKYNVALIAAFQSFSSVPEPLLRQILGNVGTIISFELGATDARRLSREFVSETSGVLTRIEPEEFIGLKVGQAICRIGRSILRVTTPPPADHANPSSREEIIRRSRERFGSPIVAVSRRRPPDGGVAGLSATEVF